MSDWLVDTHALLSFLEDDPQLSAAAKATMESDSSVLLVSTASVWEMAIKASTGKLTVPDDLLETISDQGFATLEITNDHAWRVRELPLGEHKDPFDRLIAAQALIEDLPVISNDGQLDQYGVIRHW